MHGLVIFSVLLTFVNTASLSLFEPHAIGGFETSINQHPYQAVTFSLQGCAFGAYFCGAVVVSSKHIITLANCMWGKNFPELYMVEVGSSSHRADFSSYYEVEKIVHHPKHRTRANSLRESVHYDIAIATLRTPVIFNDAVQPISLVPVHEEPQPGEVLTVTGWGHYDLYAPLPALQEVRVKAVAKDRCQMKYPEIEITETIICAGDVDTGITELDYGGPLVNKRKQLVGLAAQTSRGEDPGTPALYVSFASSSIRDFVISNIQ